MSQPDLAAAVTQLVAILSKFKSSDDRAKIIAATTTLLGVAGPEQVLSGPAGSTQKLPNVGNAGAPNLGAQQYFDQKDPKSRSEMLAVAARFLEVKGKSDTMSRADLQAVFTEARRDFDTTNFGRDIGNARNCGFFNKDTGRGAIRLSHNGQKLVDMLPNRESIKAVRKPKTASRRAPRKSAAHPAT